MLGWARRARMRAQSKPWWFITYESMSLLLSVDAGQHPRPDYVGEQHIHPLPRNTYAHESELVMHLNAQRTIPVITARALGYHACHRSTFLTMKAHWLFSETGWHPDDAKCHMRVHFQLISNSSRAQQSCATHILKSTSWSWNWLKLKTQNGRNP